MDGGWDIKWKSGNGGLMERNRGKEGGRQEKKKRWKGKKIAPILISKSRRL